MWQPMFGVQMTCKGAESDDEECPAGSHAGNRSGNCGLLSHLSLNQLLDLSKAGTNLKRDQQLFKNMHMN